jgi:5'-nucleotidase
MTRPLVLVSNDDGYRSLGISALADALGAYFDVVICAPHSEQSASSHALSLHRPLRIEKHSENVFSVDGTPADSVYIALHEPTVLPRAPSLVVSGMNHGLNLGQDVFYSGTVAAAREGALQGFPALAVSAHAMADLGAATKDAARIARALLQTHQGGGCLLNVNYPPGNAWTKAPTVSGRRVYTGGLVTRQDPRGRPYYWIGGDNVSHIGEGGTDTEAFDAGIVGITPLCLDLSATTQNERAQRVCLLASENDGA